MKFKLIHSLLVFTLSLMTFPFMVHAQEVFEYRTFDADSGKEIGKLRVTINRMEDDRTIVKTDYEDFSDPQIIDRSISVLGPDLETIRYESKDTESESNFILTQSDNILSISGKLDGEEMNKSEKLDNPPFYHDPRFCLMQFALSGNDEMRFLVVNPDDQKIYEMKAERKSVEEIEVNGKQVNAVEVYWGLPGIGFIAFNQTYWYRKSDGIFLKQNKPFSGKKFELIID